MTFADKKKAVIKTCIKNLQDKGYTLDPESINSIPANDTDMVKLMKLIIIEYIISQK